MSSLVGMMLPVDPAALSRDGLLDALEELQRVKAVAAAAEARVLARLEALDRVELPHTQWSRESVSSMLRCAPRTAAGRLAEAATLVARFPTTLAALESGSLTAGHVHALLDATDALDADSAAAVEARVLVRAEDTSIAEFRARCRRAVLRADPAGEAHRHDTAYAERRVDFLPDDAGMTRIIAGAAADVAARVRQHLDACVDTILHANPEDPRGRDAIRVDVLTDLLTGCEATPMTTVGGSVRPIQVAVAISTLLNLDELPGEIDGEPAAAPLARALANDPAAWWRPVLVDRDGHAEALGARTYRPSVMLRRLVEIHDRTCQFPGCRRRATRCELDHVRPFDPDRGGLTELANLHALCERHHRLKHETGWTAIRKDGHTHWRSPHDRTYRKAFEPLVDPPDPDPPPY